MSIIHRPTMVEAGWYVDDVDDCRTTQLRSTALNGNDAAREIGEAWWHRSGDYCAEFDLTITTPERFAGRYHFTVESEPVFYVRKVKS